MRGEAVQTLSNQVARLSSNLVPIIPPHGCKGTTAPSLGGFNPFEEGEQGRMGAVWRLHLSPPSPARPGMWKAKLGLGLNTGVSGALHGESGKADPTTASWSLPGPSQLQVAPKALGREERGRTRRICRIWEPALQAAGRDGPHPSTSILIPLPLQSWGPHTNPPCPAKPGGHLEPSLP